MVSRTNLLVVVIVAAALIAMFARPGPIVQPTAAKPPVVSKLTSRSYHISESEHVVLIDVPDKYIPRRCMVFVNEITHTSNLTCNFDGAGSGFPPAEEE